MVINGAYHTTFTARSTQRQIPSPQTHGAERGLILPYVNSELCIVLDGVLIVTYDSPWLLSYIKRTSSPTTVDIYI